MYSIGLTNYKYRKCLQTDVDIWRTTTKKWQKQMKQSIKIRENKVIL